MAAAVRVSRPRPALALVPSGSFGRKTAAVVSESFPDCVTYPDGAVDAAFAGVGDVVVIPMWRPVRWLCERADELAFTVGRPWLPVVMEQRRISVGPLVQPPDGPCHRCLNRRRAQHDDRLDETQALQGGLEAGAPSGVLGYLPHHARLAAGLALSLMACGLRNWPGPAASDPTVITVQLPQCAIASSTVVACHDCPHCYPAGGLLRVPGSVGQVLRQLQESRP